MADVTLPYTFTNGVGHTADATQVMANFNALLAGLNDISKEQLSSALMALVWQPGMYSWTAGATADPGFLLCDGSIYLRTDYPDLFARIGTTHNQSTANGYPTTVTVPADSFQVPDARGRFLFMQNFPFVNEAHRIINLRLLGQLSGNESHTNTPAEGTVHGPVAVAGAQLAPANVGAGGNGYEIRNGDTAWDTTPPRLAANLQIKT